MKNTKRGSAGGQKIAIIQKEQAKQRIDEYNKHPNICMCCGKSILAQYGKHLSDFKRRKFCSRKCSSFYNKKYLKRKTKTNNVIDSQSFISKIPDDKIIMIFNDSKSLKDFGEKLGYKKLQYRNKSVCNKLKSLGLNINDFRIREDADIINKTKDEIFKKYSNWQTSRSKIQSHARSTYECSDKPKKCIICGYDKHYEVAHIKSVSSFNGNCLVSEINHINNLMALCPNHHWEYDNNNLDVKPYLSKID